MHYLPLSPTFFAILVALFLLLVALIQVGILRYAYMRLGVSSGAALSLLLASLIGSYVNIPLFQLPVDAVRCEPVSNPNSLLTGKLTGNFADLGPLLAIFVTNRRSNSMAFRMNSLRKRTGNVWRPNREFFQGTGNFFQLTEAYGWQQTPRYIVRDRDCVYGDVILQRLRAMGIRDRPISPRSPWQNGYSERLIGSIRRDCLDHVVVFGERHLRHLLNSYQKYYNDARTHLSLHKDAPIPRAVQTVGRTLAMPVLGGLHHQYFRA
jgi:hypothetical protein